MNPGETTRRSFPCIAAVAVLLAAHLASAQPTNPGFETGSFAGWLVAGTSAASITGAYSGGPTEGAFQARLTNELGSVSDATLAAFFGLPATAFDMIAGGNATEGSAIRQTFTAPSGTIVAFDWNFITDELTPATFNDFAFFVFNGSAKKLADTTFQGFFLSPPTF